MSSTQRIVRFSGRGFSDLSLEENDSYDPRVVHFYDPNENCYTRGPGAHLLSEQQPYNIRKSGLPYSLIVFGIHPSITEEGLFNVFSNYGNPVTVERKRDRMSQPIGFVKFQTQREADTAIIGLNGKAPLHWIVKYTNTSLRSENDEKIQLIDQLNEAFTISLRQKQELEAELKDLEEQAINQAVNDYPPCTVCKLEARLVCTVCKTRYCSQFCQNSDWPQHKHQCFPPPLLETSGELVVSRRSSPSIIEKLPISGPRGRVNLPRSDLRNHLKVPKNLRSNATGRPRSDSSPNDIRITISAASSDCMIQGIQALDHHSEKSASPHRAPHRPPHRSEKENLVKSPQRASNSRESPRIPKIYCTKYSGGLQTLPTTSPFNAIVCFSKSPDKFYFHLETVLPTLEKIQKEIQVAASNAEELKSPFVGCPCFVLFDGGWFRGEVIQLCGANDVGVRYVDYGNTAKLANTADLIRKMDSEFGRYPFFAIGAKLADVLPIQNGVWSQTEKDKFKDLVVNRILSLEPINYENELLCVRLKQPKAAGLDLAQYMIKHNLAKSSGKQLPASDTLERVVSASNCSRPISPSSKSNHFHRTGALPKTSSYPDRHVTKGTSATSTDQLTPNPKLPTNVNDRAAKSTTQPPRITGAIPKVSSYSGQHVATATSANSVRQLVPTPSLSTDANAGASKSTAPLSHFTGAIPKVSYPAQPVATVTSSTSVRQPTPTFSINMNDRAGKSPLPEVRTPHCVGDVVKLAPILITTPPPPLNTSPTTVTKSPVNSTTVLKSTPNIVPVTSSPAAAAASPISESIICQLATGSRVQFTVSVSFDRNFCAGTLVSKPEDVNVLAFNSFALTLETVAGFSPSVGSVVAAFSLEYDEWFRAYIVSANKNVYSVIYVDFGNFEDGIVDIKPIPATYRQEELGVKLSLVGGESASIQRYCLAKLLAETNHWLEIVDKGDDFVQAILKNEEADTFRVQLESWTSLAKQPTSSQSRPQIIEGRRREPGFTGDVIPVVIEDLNHFFVVFFEDLDTCEEIQAKLRSISASSPSLSCPTVGGYVIALFPEDGDFYRAVVTRIDGGSIHVHYIDLGTSAVVSLKELKVLPDDMFKYPACATRINLSQVPHSLGALPANVRSHLEDCIDQKFTIFILPSTEPSVVECTLSKDGEVLNDSILDLMESGQESNNIQVSESMAPVGAVEDITAGSSSSIEMPQLVVKDVTEGEFQVDNSLVRISYDEGVFMKFPEESEFQALILTSEQPQCLMMAAVDKSALLKLNQLQEDMRRYSEGIIIGHTPMEGEVCIVKSPEDGLWYRAAVLQATDYSWLCILIDYGQILTISSEHIRRIPKRFVDYMPFVAQRAMLNELKDIAPEKIDERLVTRISTLLPENSFVSVRVVGQQDLAYVVEIPSVTKILLDEGLLKSLEPID